VNDGRWHDAMATGIRHRALSLIDRRRERRKGKEVGWNGTREKGSEGKWAHDAKEREEGGSRVRDG
jgi:hypothetical protein